MSARELTSLSPLLRDAQRGHYAVGSFSCINAETAQAIAETADSLRSPVIMMAAPVELELIGPKLLVEIVGSIASQAAVPICLHLDHSDDPEFVLKCIDAGFPSVMIDASQQDYEENVRLTRLVVEMAHPRGVSVEGELGAVGRVDDTTFEGGGRSSLTDPDQAADFVKRTGIDALAVAIGNAHGIYSRRPELDIDLLQAIQEAVDVPLVLHGGSGTPTDQLREAIDIGITKVNVGSELCRAYLNTVCEGVNSGSGEWYSMILTHAKAAFAGVVAEWMHKLGSAGRA